MGENLRNTLPRAVRIRSKADFDRVFKLGCRASDSWLTVLAAPNATASARLGISVSRRFGKAVDRNRIKRLIREAFRTVRHELPLRDWVVIPRPGRWPTIDDLRLSLFALCRRLEQRLARSSESPSQ